MPWILLHQTWQMNLLANNPPVPDQRWLAYHYTNLGRWTYLGQWTPQYQSRDDIMAKVWKVWHSPFLRYPIPLSQDTFLLGKWLSLIPRAPEIPTRKFSGVLNTMAKVWKLLVFRGAEHNGKGLKALAFTISEIPQSIFSKHIFAEKVASFHS